MSASAGRILHATTQRLCFFLLPSLLHSAPHHATHTLDVQWYGRMALAFRWRVRRLDVGQRMAKWMVD
jgi:hypothetical protein